MAVDLSALVDFRSVVRAKFGTTDFHHYRYLLSDECKGVAAFFDLDYRGVNMDKMFIVQPLSLLATMDDDIEEARDVWPPAELNRPQREQDGEKGYLETCWDGRWDAVKGIVAQDEADMDLLEGHPVTELFLNARWRESVIERHATKRKISMVSLRRHLGTFLRFGGTKEALIPQTLGHCGAPGQPKSEWDHKKKFGRKTTTQRRGRAAWNGRNGVGPFWVKRITDAFDVIIERDKEGAWSTLQNDDLFLGVFFDNCCFETDADGQLHAIDSSCYPTYRQILYHRDRILLKRPELLPEWKTLSHLHGGYATDLTYDVLSIGDIDATPFVDYVLGVAKDETLPFSKDNCIQIGSPTLFLGFSRDSGAAVGCEVDCNPEYGDPYRYCMYDMMLAMEDKAEKLRELGLDPARLPGIVSGGFDVIVADRGPAASQKVMQWTVAQKMDIRLTRSGAPMDKGTGERGIGQIKSWFRKQRRAMRKLIVRRTLRKLRALPLTFQNQQYIMDHHRQRNEAKKRRVTIVSKSAFLRAVIEAMNEVNLMRKKDPRRLTEDMLFSPHPPEPTAASIFNYYQGLRRGTANYPRRAVDLRESLLFLEDCPVVRGRIHLAGCPCWYGSPACHEIGREGAERLVAHVEDKALDPKAGHEVMVRATRIPGKNLVWCLLDTGEWLLLSPDTKSGAAYGVTRDLSDTRAVQDKWCMDNETARNEKSGRAGERCVVGQGRLTKGGTDSG